MPRLWVQASPGAQFWCHGVGGVGVPHLILANEQQKNVGGHNITWNHSCGVSWTRQNCFRVPKRAPSSSVNVGRGVTECFVFMVFATVMDSKQISNVHEFHDIKEDSSGSFKKWISANLGSFKTLAVLYCQGVNVSVTVVLMCPAIAHSQVGEATVPPPTTLVRMEANTALFWWLTENS